MKEGENYIFPRNNPISTPASTKRTMEAQAPRVAGVDLSTSSADEKRLHIDTEGKVVPVDDAAFLLLYFTHHTPLSFPPKESRPLYMCGLRKHIGAQSIVHPWQRAASIFC